MADEPEALEKLKVKPNRIKWGLWAAGLTGSVAVGLCVVSAPFVSPALRKHCLPYVPATSRQIENVLTMCKFQKQNSGPSQKDVKACKLIDLGSGDGRIVLEAAKHGFHSTGVELNVWLVLYSKLKARFQGLHGLAEFQRKDLWKINLSEYDRIVIFGVSEMMSELRDKLQREVNENASVVACRFPMPKWTPLKSVEEGIDSVWLYTANEFKNNPKSK